MHEAAIWQQLFHPNILPFYGMYFLEDYSQLRLVSPWMDNGNAINYLRENPLADRVSLVCGMDRFSASLIPTAL
jgi:serine/threonine protein kinase